MARVFISHAGGDMKPTAEVQRWLIEDGHEVFLDRDADDGIQLGDEWEQRLHERLRWSDAVVCIVTSAYVKSPWCTAEVGAARSRGSRMLPVVAESGVVHPLLRPVHHTDMARDPIAARRALSEALRRVDASGGAGWPDDESPFPGLVPFDSSLRRVFFGRSSEINRFLEILRSPVERAEGGIHLFVGPSGCGKSSLVRAGLVPTVADEPDWWTLPPFVPGTDPVGALARTVAATARQVGLAWTVAHVRTRLDESSGLVELADEILLAAPGGKARQLLVVADQFEELLTQTAASERARFAELLHEALTGPVLVVATLRSEFLDQLLTQPELADLRPRLHPVQPLRLQALRAVIEEPARFAGIRVEGELVDRLVADTDSGAALPLLAFTLAELATGVGRGDELSAARYDQLGGVQGALTRQADAALADAMQVAGRSRDDVLAGLLRLVTVDEQGNPTSWRVDRSELPDTVDAELGAFVARRLLITDTGDDGSAVIGVAHEAFLTAWAPLADAIDAQASALRARRAVEHGAAEWDRSGRPNERLWERGQLAAAVADTGARVEPMSAPPDPSDAAPSGRAHWALRLTRRRDVVTDRIPVSTTARAFLLASIRRDRLRRGRATAILSVLCVLALVAAGIAVVQQRAAQDQQRAATARQLIAQADVIRGSDPQTALMLGIAAERIHPDAHTRAALVEGLTSSPYAGTLSTGGGAPVFTADGRLMATAGGGVTLWDLLGERPRQLGPPLPSDVPLTLEGFSPDGSILATTRSDDTVVLWDVTAPSAPRPVGQPIPVPAYALIRFSPDGRTLAVGDPHPATVELWDISDPADARRLGEPIALGTLLQLLEFHSTGTALVTATLRETEEPEGVVVWDITDPTNPIGAPLDYGGKAAFHPGTGLLATTTDDYGNSVTMWDLTDPANPQQLPGDAGGVLNLDASVNWLKFAPDGARLAAASQIDSGRGELVIWDATTRRTQPPYSQRIEVDEAIVDVAFTGDPHIVATVVGSLDINSDVTLWDLSDPTTALQIGPPIAAGSGPGWAAAMLPNGRSLLTNRADGTATLWDLLGPERPRQLGPPIGDTGGVTSLAFFPGPDALTILRGGGSVEQHTFDGSAPSGPARQLSPGLGISAVIAPQTGLIAAEEGDGSTVLTDLHDGARTGRIPEPLPLGFSPDGQVLAVGLYNNAADPDLSMTLWDVSDPTRPRRLSAPIGLGSFRAAFSPNRPLLATQAYDRRRGVQLIDISDPTRPEPIGDAFTGLTGFIPTTAFSQDGRILAVGVDRSITLWDVTDPADPRPLGQPLTGHATTVLSLALSPDGRTMASGSHSEVFLWDLTDRTQPRRIGSALAGDEMGATALLFSTDGNSLIVGDGAVTAWDLSGLNALRNNARQEACERTGRGLDPNEWARYIAGLDYQETCNGRG